MFELLTLFLFELLLVLVAITLRAIVFGRFQPIKLVLLGDKLLVNLLLRIFGCFDAKVFKLLNHFLHLIAIVKVLALLN